ncbi:MAG TPA: hypothetical protein VNH11_34265 [Pirellulales bacterium]|nr:hypothetical protein [Pirellulales bacterium]
MPRSTPCAQARRPIKARRWLKPTLSIAQSEMERTLSIVGGAALVLFGLDRLPKTSLLLMAGRLYAIDRGVIGHCQVYEQLGIDHGGHLH